MVHRRHSRNALLTGTVTPNLDRILTTEEGDIRQLVIEDLSLLFRKVHKKYGFTDEMPEAE